MNLAADRHPSLATCLCDSISPDIVGNFEFRENPISSLVLPRMKVSRPFWDVSENVD